MLTLVKYTRALTSVPIVLVILLAGSLQANAQSPGSGGNGRGNIRRNTQINWQINGQSASLNFADIPAACANQCSILSSISALAIALGRPTTVLILAGLAQLSLSPSSASPRCSPTAKTRSALPPRPPHLWLVSIASSQTASPASPPKMPTLFWPTKAQSAVSLGQREHSVALSLSPRRLRESFGPYIGRDPLVLTSNKEAHPLATSSPLPLR